MFLKKTTSTLPLFLVLAVLAAGCGRTDQSVDTEPQQRDLSEIYEMYRAYMKAHQQQPPGKLSDFRQLKRTNAGGALQALQQGKYVMVQGVQEWDAGTVLAYEKDAPSNGGWALMADGKIKRMESSEFANLPPPLPR